MMASGFMQRFKGKIRASAIYMGSAASHGLWADGMANGYIRCPITWSNAGAPTNGGAGTLFNITQPGDLLVDTTNKTLYQNTGTSASPTWTLIEAASGQLPVGATGTFGAGPSFLLQGDISVQQSAAGVGNTNDTTEDTLFTYSLPANALNANGRILNIAAFGTFANNAHSKHARLYFGSEVIDSGANTTTGGIAWRLEMQVVRTGASTQQISGQMMAGTVHGGTTLQAGAETDSSAIAIKVTGQTGTAAASDIVCNGMTINAAN
jgi:hypothetical protein